MSPSLLNSLSQKSYQLPLLPWGTQKQSEESKKDGIWERLIRKLSCSPCGLRRTATPNRGGGLGAVELQFCLEMSPTPQLNHQQKQCQQSPQTHHLEHMLRLLWRGRSSQGYLQNHIWRAGRVLLAVIGLQGAQYVQELLCCIHQKRGCSQLMCKENKGLKLITPFSCDCGTLHLWCRAISGKYHKWRGLSSVQRIPGAYWNNK